LTNSAARLGPFARAREANEDVLDINQVAPEFGVQYREVIDGETAVTIGSHPLVEGVDELTMIGGNGVSMAVEGAFNTLARSGEALAAVRLDFGGAGGEVVALADIGLLISRSGQPTNFRFWQNLVDYARDRNAK